MNNSANEPGKTGLKAQDILNAHPQGVRSLFKSYGFNTKSVSLQDVADLHKIAGEPFLFKFYEIAHPHKLAKHYSNFVDDQTTKKSGWDAFKAGFKDVVSSIPDIINTADQYQQAQAKKEADAKNSASSDKKSGVNILVLGIAVIIVLFITILIIKKL